MTLTVDLRTPTGIQVLRGALNMNMTEFADAVRCSVKSVQNWEYGISKPSRVYLEHMLELAQQVAQP